MSAADFRPQSPPTHSICFLWHPPTIICPKSFPHASNPVKIFFFFRIHEIAQTRFRASSSPLLSLHRRRPASLLRMNGPRAAQFDFALPLNFLRAPPYVDTLKGPCHESSAYFPDDATFPFPPPQFLSSPCFARRVTPLRFFFLLCVGSQGPLILFLFLHVRSLLLCVIPRLRPPLLEFLFPYCFLSLFAHLSLDPHGSFFFSPVRAR